MDLMKSQLQFEFTENTYRFIAVDVETANRNAHSICQIGLAMVRDCGTIEGASLLVDPDEEFSGFNIRLHGIDEETVRGHPLFPDVLDPLTAFLERHILVQHSGFDKRAFDHACRLYQRDPLATSWYDSVKIARRAWPELKGNGGHGLASLKTHLNLDFKHHDAAEDARAAAQVVLLAEERTGKPFLDIL